jgi:hypothetical protein
MDRFLTIPIFYAFSLILLELKGLNWPSKNCVKKIRNEDVRKNLRVAVEFKFFVVMSSPKSVVGDPSPPQTCGDRLWIPY